MKHYDPLGAPLYEDDLEEHPGPGDSARASENKLFFTILGILAVITAACVYTVYRLIRLAVEALS